MRMPDHDPRQDCRVIPFVRPVASEDAILTSSIAAVIAVTILHREGDHPKNACLTSLTPLVKQKYLMLRI